MNFVDEDDGAMAGAGFLLTHGHNFFDFLDTSKNGAERNEFGTCQTRNEAREGGLSTAGRAPEEHGAEIVVFDLNAKRFARTEKFSLANELIEDTRTHALGEGLVGRGNVGFRGRWRQF